MFHISLLSVSLFILSIAFSSEASAERKMGIELEMDNIKFDDTNFKGEDLRHLKLLTVKKNEKEIAYIEIDSDNKDIEFVSQPFSLTAPSAFTVNSDDQVKILEAFMQAVFETEEKEKRKNDWRVILDQEKVSERIKQLDENYTITFHVKKPVALLLPLGIWPENLPQENEGEEQEEVAHEEESDLKRKLNVINVRPQATFQIELEVVPEFIKSLWQDNILKHEVTASGSNLKKQAINKVFLRQMKLLIEGDNTELSSSIYPDKHSEKGDARLKKIVGFYYLSKLYLINLLANNRLQEYLNKVLYGEGGVKGLLPIMSRISFSEMYHRNRLDGNVLEKLAEEKEGFKIRGERFPDYVISKAPHWLDCKECGQDRKCLSTAINGCEKGRNFRKYILPEDVLAVLRKQAIFKDNLEFKQLFTAENWLKSIKTPIVLGFTAKPDKEVLPFFSARVRLFQDRIKKEHPDLQAQRVAWSQEDFITELFSRNDLLYPVPFLSAEDSMGSFQWKDDFLGHAILEVRRYANYFRDAELYKKGQFLELPKFLLREAERIKGLK